MPPTITLQFMDTYLLWRYCPCAEVHLSRDQYFSGSTLCKPQVVWRKVVVEFPKKFWCQRILTKRSLEPGYLARCICSSTIELLSAMFGSLPRTHHLYRSEGLFRASKRTASSSSKYPMLRFLFLKQDISEDFHSVISKICSFFDIIWGTRDCV